MNSMVIINHLIYLWICLIIFIEKKPVGKFSMKSDRTHCSKIVDMTCRDLLKYHYYCHDFVQLKGCVYFVIFLRFSKQLRLYQIEMHLYHVNSFLVIFQIGNASLSTAEKSYHYIFMNKIYIFKN